MPLDHVDVLIVGAGLSGIGAACHLTRTHPGRTYAILESRDAIGGTWDLFRYPGVRSDSDMYTLGYSFRPWTGSRSLADGDSIREYVRDTAREYGVDQHIRFRHQVIRADWSSADARWTVEALRFPEGAEPDAATAETVRITCSFLFCCSGYYRYDAGYTPEFPGVERFGGRIVHPQHWPADLDYAGKRVVVIGSGATAITLVPAMADDAEHVTMLQRSPSYLLSLPSLDPIAGAVQRRLPGRFGHEVVRWKNVLLAMLTFQLSRRSPGLMKSLLRKGVQRQLPEDFDVDTHFAPRYNPWDQRLCFVKDGDLFRSVRKGTASIATDTIDTFTETGIALSSGEHLDADVVVTATGLNLLAMGGMRLAVDGNPVDIGETLAYKGMMLSGVPNFALALGYTNASWTLKCDLVSQYVCRVLSHLDATGNQICTPEAPDLGDELAPLIDLNSGYVLRSVDALPKQGPSAPWRLYQNYPRDVVLLRRGPVTDGVRFSRAAAPAGDRDEAAVTR